MRSLFLAAILTAFALSAPRAQAQAGDAPDAAPYFHRGAQAYIGQDLERAEAEVREGLRIAPSDPRLQALLQKLQEERQQQSSSGSSQQQDAQPQEGEQGEQDERPEDWEGNDRQPPSTASPDDDRAQQRPDDAEDSDQNPARRNDERERQADVPEPEDRPDEPEDPSGAPPAGQAEPGPSPSRMSPSQASRILQALQNQEEDLLRAVLRPEPSQRPVEKDW